MNLFIPLCLLCVCVAPQGGLVEARAPPAPAAAAPPAASFSSAEDEPYVKRHHHDNNIAELLIPLLERSLQEPRAAPTARHRGKPNKKVIQVLPYRGSGEHKRKGWRKLNSHKKQVVEITPLHGKNRAKPLAYILSAAQPSRGEHAAARDDSASASLEHKYSSEEPPSSEEARHTLDSEDISVNVLGAETDASDSRSGSTGQSNENVSSKETSAGVTRESVSENSSEDKSADTEENITTKKPAKYRVNKSKHTHSRTAAHTAEDPLTSEVADVTLEESDTVEVTAEDIVTQEERTATVEDGAVSVEDNAITANDAVTSEDKAVTSEDKALISSEEVVTAEDKAVTKEYTGIVSEERAVTSEDKVETAEVIGEHAVTIEDAATAEVTVERAATVEEEATADITAEAVVTSDHVVTAETTAERAHTSEDGVSAEVTAQQTVSAEEDVSAEATAERALTAKDTPTAEDNAVGAEAISRTDHNKHTHNGHAHLTDIKHLLGNLNINAKATDDSEDAPSAFIENDIVIRHAHRAGDSAENFGKLFGARAQDIVELVQASAEPPACTDRADRERSRDHKSYRLSFLFNKK